MVIECDQYIPEELAHELEQADGVARVTRLNLDV